MGSSCMKLGRLSELRIVNQARRTENWYRRSSSTNWKVYMLSRFSCGSAMNSRFSREMTGNLSINISINVHPQSENVFLALVLQSFILSHFLYQTKTFWTLFGEHNTQPWPELRHCFGVNLLFLLTYE